MAEQRKQLLCKIIYLLGLSSLVSLAAPQTLRIDGSLFNASGVPITGNRDVQIKAYDAATGGSAVWTSSVYTAAVSNGRFSIALDATADTTSLTTRLAAKAANGEIWFAIDYDTGTADGDMDSAVTVTPRIRGKGSMFALVAAKADGLTGVTATAAEMNYLSGVTSSIQSQLANSGASGKVSKSGDSMSGALEVGADVKPMNIDLNIASGKIKIGGTTILSVGTGVGAANTFGGASAGGSNTSGIFNTFYGYSSGAANTTGGGNAFFGTNSGLVNVNGGNNSIFGSAAGVSNISGSDGSFFGNGAGNSNTGSSNSFFGSQAGRLNSSGRYNSFFGHYAGYTNATADGNSYFGYYAGRSATGTGNALFGYYSGGSLDSGGNNSIFGYEAGYLATTSSDSTFLGYRAGFTVSTQAKNTFLGSGADDTSGAARESIALGYGAKVTASSSIQIGAGVNSTPNSLQFWGYNFLDSSGNATFNSINSTVSSTELGYLDGVTANIQSQLANSGASGKVSKTGDSMSGALEVGSTLVATGAVTAGGSINLTAANGEYHIAGTRIIGVGTGVNAFNMFVGSLSGVSVTSGTYNTFVGYQAGNQTKTDSDETAVGYNAQATGGSSAAVGSGARASGNSSTALGYQAIASGNRGMAIGFASQGSGNLGTGIGYGAVGSGTWSTAVGYGAKATNYTSSFGLQAGIYSTTGSYGTFIGTLAAQNNTSGNVNTVVGAYAGLSITTASENTLVGASTDVANTASSSVALGYKAIVNASSAMQLGTGTNSTPNSLQFWGYNFLDSSGNATFNSINSTVSSTELGYLDGVTANIQSQLASSGAASRVSKTGDSMSGALEVGAAVTATGNISSGAQIAGQTLNLTAEAASIKIGGNAFIGVGTGVDAANLTIGRYAGAALTGDAGANTFVGFNSGAWNSTGGANSFFGASSGWNNDTGNANSFFGDSSGYGNVGGLANAYFGAGAGYVNGSGSRNSAFGASAGYNITGSDDNTFIGNSAGLTVTTMGRNTLVGSSSDAGASAEQSIAVGYAAVAAASSAVQIGSGTNSTANSVQFGTVNFTNTELGYLDGATANVQTQINAIATNIKFNLLSKSANFTANDGAGSYYRISATATCTLPASPADGRVMKFKVTGGTTTFDTTGGEVINRANGTTNTSGTLTLESQDGVLELIAVSGGWDET